MHDYSSTGRVQEGGKRERGSRVTDQPIVTGEISFLGSWGVPAEWCTGAGTGTSRCSLDGR